jgi:hypothetical protein
MPANVAGDIVAPWEYSHARHVGCGIPSHPPRDSTSMTREIGFVLKSHNFGRRARNAEPGESILVRNLNALRSSTPDLQRHREIRPRDGSNRRRRLSILIALLCPLTLTEAHTWAAAVLVDELDACGFSCASNCQVISVDHRHTHTTKSHMQYHAADSGRNEM